MLWILGLAACENTKGGSSVDLEGVDSADEGDSDSAVVHDSAPEPIGVEVASTCLGAPGSVWYAFDAEGSALRLLAVGTSYMGFPTQVYVQDNTPLTLVLSSTGAVDWEVYQSETSTVQRVILNSEEEGSTVLAPSGAEVEEHQGSGSWESGYSWYDAAVQRLIGTVEDEVSSPLATFAGCGATDSFTIEPTYAALDTTDRPDCDTPSTWTPLEPPDLSLVEERCPDQIAEESWCLVTGAWDVIALGLDSDTTCTVTDYVAGSAAGLSSESVALSGEQLYSCQDDYGELARISLEDGAVERALTWCGSATWNDADEVISVIGPDLTGDGNPIFVYSSWDQAQCSAPEESGVLLDGAAALDVFDGMAWWIDSRADTVYRTLLSSGEDLEPIPLPPEWSRIGMLSVARGGEELVVYVDGDLKGYTPTTGETHLHMEVDPSTGVHGITCFDR